MVSASASRLVLGTVQWGLPYGVANRSGVPSDSELDELLAVARGAGLETLDTARAYGRAEERIGALLGESAAWRVVTKLSPEVAPPDLDAAGIRDRVRASVEASRRALRVERLDTLLLHRPAHRSVAGGAAWDELRRLRDQGRIGRLGVSALEPADAFEALDDPDVQALQVAASLLDRRLEVAGFFAAAVGRDVYVRSVYLQGLAFLPAAALPAGLEPLAPVLRALDDAAAGLGLARWKLFLAYARDVLAGRPVLGFEAANQLREALDAWVSLPRLQAGLLALASDLPVLESRWLQPSLWPLEVCP